MKRTIYVCPGEGCAFLSMTPGKCRSHPYPCRAMGPKLVPLEVVPLEDLQSDETRDVVARAFASLVGADPDLAGSIFGERADGVLRALVAHFSQDFGPREDEDGEGVKPVDPSDGAANQGKQRSAPRPADCSGPAPDAEQQEGAESSRVGRPSASDDESGTCICTDADDPNDHRKDCPQWRAAVA
jgi:hypothetical protein